MKTLQPLAQHWAITLSQQPTVDMNDTPRVDPQQVAVIREVVNRAEREPVHDSRCACLVSILNDVGGLD